jgi:hypothetical protein
LQCDWNPVCLQWCIICFFAMRLESGLLAVVQSACIRQWCIICFFAMRLESGLLAVVYNLFLCNATGIRSACTRQWCIICFFAMRLTVTFFMFITDTFPFFSGNELVGVLVVVQLERDGPSPDCAITMHSWPIRSAPMRLLSFRVLQVALRSQVNFLWIH